MRISGNIIYEERVFFWVISAILIPVMLIFIFLFVYQVTVGPIGQHPAPTWFFPLLIIIFLVFELVFHSYYLIITSDQLIAGFPAYKKYISWDKIEDAKIDTKNAWLYGGYGIRVVGKKGNRTLAIIVPETKRVILKLRNSKWDFMVLSVKNVKVVVNYITQEIEIHK